jgi:DNA-directed RNA polymerase specialized sigma24 family protein
MADLDRYLPGIAAGDPKTFGRWVAGAEFRIRASLSSFATVVDTEAVVQECLLRVWQVAPRVQPDGKGDSLVRLAIRIAHNFAISEVRRTRSRPFEPVALEQVMLEHGQADSPDPESALSDPLLRDVIELCRKKLPMKPSLALGARLSGSPRGMPDEALAARLGMKLNTFLQNFTRARRFLAECLREHGVDLETML